MNGNGESIYKLGCLIYLHIRAWGASAKLADEMIEDKFSEDSEVIRAVQDLLTKDDKKFLENFRTVKNEAKGYVSRISISSPVPGFDFILKKSIGEANDYLKRRQAEYFALRAQFIEDIYEPAKERFKEKYPELFRADKYPTKERLESMFTFRWTFKQLDVPDPSLGTLDPELYQEEMEKAKREVEWMKQTTLMIVKKSFLDRLDALKKMCSGEQQMSTSTLKSVDSLLEKFEEIYKNFINVNEVKKVAAELSEYIRDVDTDMLKADDRFRKMVEDKSSELAKRMQKGAPDPKGGRAILI